MAEPLNATFFALRKRDRAVLLPATLAYVVIMALLLGALAALNWSALNTLFAMMRDWPAQPSDAEVLRMFSGMMGLFGWTLLFLFPIYIAMAAFEAACLRWMIRGEAPGLFGLALNEDTWRVWGVYWVWLLAQWVVGFAASLLMMPLMFVMMGEMAAQVGQPPDPNAMLQLQLKLQALSLIQYIPLAFIGIRFGPAAATSIARKQFSFFEAWNVTRGRFFALLGSFAMLWLGFALIVAAVSAPVVWRMWPRFAALWSDPNEEAMRSYFEAYLAPETLIWAGLGYAVMVIGGLCLAVLSYGINARTVLAAIEEGKIQGAAASHG